MTERVIVLLAGYPGTGKTYLSRYLINEIGLFDMISPDEIKEDYCDIYGYTNLKEKKKIEQLAWKQYYKTMEQKMESHVNIMSDYPFSQKQKPYLQQLIDKHEYKVITIRLIADLDILYERQRNRDLDPSRHLSHIVTSYQKGDTLLDRRKADNLLDYQTFIDRCINRGYDQFELGITYEIDTTNYATGNYPMLVNAIKSL